MKKIIPLLLIVLISSFSCKRKYLDPNMVSTVINGISISTWMYQIQNLEETARIDELDNTEYDMLVVEPGFNFTEYPYNTQYMTNKLKTKPNGDPRLLLAYIDIGEAEDYRDYWQSNWIAPTATTAGYPDFLVTIDPDGWSGNYPVAYWDSTWQDLWIGSNGLIQQIANYGFDGIYLDWVEAYDDDKVRARAAQDGVNPENEMMLFIQKLKQAGQTIKSDFVVISRNAPYLIDANPSFYTSIIDGIATEDTWFYGEGDAEWNDENAGDLSGGDRHDGDYSTDSRIEQNRKYLEYGVPVFTVDYCISKRKAKKVYKHARYNGFIPLVTRVSLSEITETPPWFD